MPDGALATVPDCANGIYGARRDIPAVCDVGGQPAIRAGRIDHGVSPTEAVVSR